MNTKNHLPIALTSPALASLGLAALLTLGTACSLTRIERRDSDGQAFTAANARLFWKSGGVDIAYERTGSNITAKAKLDQTGTDADALRAIAEGIAAGATKAAVPAK